MVTGDMSLNTVVGIAVSECAELVLPVNGAGTAKLNIASMAPPEQSAKARTTRGLKSPDCEEEFCRIRFLLHDGDPVLADERLTVFQPASDVRFVRL